MSNVIDITVKYVLPKIRVQYCFKTSNGKIVSLYVISKHTYKL